MASAAASAWIDAPAPGEASIATTSPAMANLLLHLDGETPFGIKRWYVIEGMPSETSELFLRLTEYSFLTAPVLTIINRPAGTSWATSRSPLSPLIAPRTSAN